MVDAGPRPGDHGAMKEVLRTNDPVLLSWLTALLADAGIAAIVLDTHTSIIEGSIGALPRRLVVDETDYEEAKRLVEEAGAAIARETAEPAEDSGALIWFPSLRKHWS